MTLGAGADTAPPSRGKSVCLAMISPGVQRWFAGLFACMGVAAALAGLLFGVGLLLAPKSAVAPLPGDDMWMWAWAVPTGGLLLSLGALAQAVKGRPVLLPGKWYEGPLMFFRVYRLDGIIAWLSIALVAVFLIAFGVHQAVYAQTPQLRAAAWSGATIAFGSAALPFVGFSIAAFHLWWRGRNDNLREASRTCRHCGYSLVGIRTGRCPECGQRPR